MNGFYQQTMVAENMSKWGESCLELTRLDQYSITFDFLFGNFSRAPDLCGWLRDFTGRAPVV